MCDKPTSSSTKDAVTSSDVSLRYHYAGNIYEIFVRGREITHAQIHFPGTPTFPSEAHFNDFPTAVQRYFHSILRSRR